MADPIMFTTRLTDAEWDEVMGGWRCPVLQIPGAVVEDIYVDGNQIDSGKFRVLQGQQIIRWMSAERPHRLAVIVKLTQELALGSETDKWKRRAILLPFVATLASALITAIPTYWSKLDAPVKSQSTRSPGETGNIPAIQRSPATPEKTSATPKLPDKLPADDSRIPPWVPRYPGVELKNVTIQGNIGSYYFLSRDGDDAVKNFYVSRLLIQGMKPATSYPNLVRVSTEGGQIKFLLNRNLEFEENKLVNRYTVTFSLESG